ncbi:hypothetical protein, conserved [Trypanosoma brucei brucei TREU927]|uniref:F-box domain-containing protein n=1 Tax=Trypanosoma brucei brucei (strain 927/4 GUTat10.1) TaxID=185431 RepID=Q382I2_TRYB2|nr:hypothetical protein, conserved [Trypanosoma brucei brucei TREU927]EAN80299.1 hypothetical protein, conserved [Trypanosoma brucei brucei TREU927]
MTHQTHAQGANPPDNAADFCGADDITSPASSNHHGAEHAKRTPVNREYNRAARYRDCSPNYNFEWGSMTEEMTMVGGTEFTERRGEIVVQDDEESIAFRFTNTRKDVLKFRACISYKTHRSTKNAVLPSQVGPFNDEILSVIFLYVSLDMREILNAGQVCRYWRFFANLAPHWTYYNRLDLGRRLMQLPRYLQKMVGRPRIVTRDEYFRERQKAAEFDERATEKSSTQHVRWCIAIALLSAAACAGNFFFSYYVGVRFAERYSDAVLGSIAFLILLGLVIVQVVFIIIPLGTGSTPGEKQNSMRLLAWAAFLLLTGSVLGTITTLTTTRVESTRQLLGAPVVELVPGKGCELVDLSREPAFAILPAPLSDVRWRPITTDKEEKTFLPHCASPGAGEKEVCFVLLYFDELYNSSVFSNHTQLVISKHIGTRYALSFDPFDANSSSRWCETGKRPQTIAVTMPVYVRLVEERNRNYFDDSYLDPLRRPGRISSISYQCSVKYPRIVTEDPPGASEIWYKSQVPWRQHHIPLVTDVENTPLRYLEEHNHFLHYSYACYIAAALLWLFLFVLQCFLRNHALKVLGLATTCTLLVMNPVALLVSGVLCITLSDYYFICNETTGGAMIGTGISLTAFALAAYVCFW